MRAASVEVVVDSRLRLRPGDACADDSLLDELCAAFTHEVDGGLWRGESEVARTWRTASADLDEDRGETLTLPRGGVAKMRKVLAARGLAPRFSDRRLEGYSEWAAELAGVSHEPLGHDRPGADPWPHQEWIVRAILDRECGIIRAGTGAGKSGAALRAIAAVRLPTLVVVDSVRLRDQWLDRVERELGIPGSQIGRVGDGVFDPRPVTVAIQQTLRCMDAEKWRLVERLFGFLIVDEVHCAAADLFIDVVDRMPAKYRIGLSADESRPDGLECLIYDVFGGVICDVPQSELVAAGHTVEVKVRVVPTAFAADWYVKQRRDHGMGKRWRPPDRNKLLAEMAGDAARNEICAALAVEEVRQGRQVVVFSHRRAHCLEMNRRAAQAGIPSGLIVGGVQDREESRRSVQGLLSGKLRWATGTVQAIGKGLDLPSVEAGVLTMPVSSRQPLDQIKGRFCRRPDGKESATLYVVHDQRVFGARLLRDLERWFGGVEVLLGKWTDLDGGVWVPVRDYLTMTRRGLNDEAKRGKFGGGQGRLS